MTNSKNSKGLKLEEKAVILFLTVALLVSNSTATNFVNAQDFDDIDGINFSNDNNEYDKKTGSDKENDYTSDTGGSKDGDVEDLEKYLSSLTDDTAHGDKSKNDDSILSKMDTNDPFIEVQTDKKEYHASPLSTIKITGKVGSINTDSFSNSITIRIQSPDGLVDNRPHVPVAFIGSEERSGYTFKVGKFSEDVALSTQNLLGEYKITAVMDHGPSAQTTIKVVAPPKVILREPTDTRFMYINTDKREYQASPSGMVKITGKVETIFGEPLPSYVTIRIQSPDGLVDNRPHVPVAFIGSEERSGYTFKVGKFSEDVALSTQNLLGEYKITAVMDHGPSAQTTIKVIN